MVGDAANQLVCIAFQLALIISRATWLVLINDQRHILGVAGDSLKRIAGAAEIHRQIIGAEAASKMTAKHRRRTGFEAACPPAQKNCAAVVAKHRAINCCSQGRRDAIVLGAPRDCTASCFAVT